MINIDDMTINDLWQAVFTTDSNGEVCIRFLEGMTSWKPPVDTYWDLPLVWNSVWDTRIAKDDFNIYTWNWSSWVNKVWWVDSVNAWSGIAVSQTTWDITVSIDLDNTKWLNFFSGKIWIDIDATLQFTAGKVWLDSTLKSNYDTAYTNSHTHANKTILDNISATSISHRDWAYSHSILVSWNPHNVTKTDVGLSNVSNLAQVATTTDQTIAWTKTFSTAPILSSLTANRIPFLDANKQFVTDDNWGWDNTNKRLWVWLNNPSYRLHVYTYFWVATENWIRMQHNAWSNNKFLDIFIWGAEGSTLVNIAAKKWWWDTPDISFTTNSANALFIQKDTWRVWFSKTNPSYPIDVNGTANATTFRTDAWDTINWSVVTLVSWTYPRIYSSQSDVPIYIWWNTTTNKSLVIYKTDASSVANHLVTVLWTGSVWIWTTSPSYRLDVVNSSSFVEARIYWNADWDTWLIIKDSNREWKVWVDVWNVWNWIFNIFDVTWWGSRFNIWTTWNVSMWWNLWIWATATTTSKLHISWIPTSSAGLVAWDVWSNSWVLTIV